MRLIGRLKKLERWLEGERSRVMAAGIVWTGDHEAWSGDAGPEGRLVTDVFITGDVGGTPTWVTRERPARDASDMGDVYGEGGELAGKVERVEGSLVVYREVGGE